MKPPITVRFCVVCKRVVEFKFNRNIGHSECCVCGARFGIKLPRCPKCGHDWKNE